MELFQAKLNQEQEDRLAKCLKEEGGYPQALRRFLKEEDERIRQGKAEVREAKIQKD